VTDNQVTIDAALASVDSLQKLLKRQTSKQVSSDDEKQIAKATALAWFNNHRPVVAVVLGDDQLKSLDDIYRALIAATTKASVRTKYLSIIKDIKRRFATVQTDHVLVLAAAPASVQASTPDTASKFDSLISDTKMQIILTKRWQECSVCVKSGAPLAATVMMGGLLEGLLLAKINQLSNKTSVFSAATKPTDPKTGKALQLKEWMLKNYIDVAHELGWITKTTKDIGEVVRDYRNFIRRKNCRTASFSKSAMPRCFGKSLTQVRHDALDFGDFEQPPACK
jgi:hypothetical protein